jgi:hypothetical protein
MKKAVGMPGMKRAPIAVLFSVRQSQEYYFVLNDSVSPRTVPCAFCATVRT